MSKTCFLHVGLHKTASSSFQETCAQNSRFLASLGFDYPLFKCEAANKNKIANHSIPIFSLFNENPKKYHVNAKWGIQEKIKEVNSSYGKQLDTYLKNSNNLVISGEDISVLSRNSMLKLINKIHQYNFKIKACAIVRSPYSALCSALQQRIKEGEFIKLISLDDSSPGSFNTQPFKKASHLKKMRDIFGNRINFYDFDVACSHIYGPAAFLLQELLNQDPSDFEYRRTNESLSNFFIRIQNEFNKTNPAFVDGRSNPQFQKIPGKIDKSFRYTGKFLLTQSEHKLIEDFIAQEAYELQAITGINFMNNAFKFSKPIFDLAST